MTNKLIIALAVLVLSGCSSPQAPTQTEFERYEKACHDRGGHIDPVAVHWRSVDYRCTGDSFQPLLPQFTDVS